VAGATVSQARSQRSSDLLVASVSVRRVAHFDPLATASWELIQRYSQHADARPIRGHTEVLEGASVSHKSPGSSPPSSPFFIPTRIPPPMLSTMLWFLNVVEEMTNLFHAPRNVPRTVTHSVSPQSLQFTLLLS
jgi:hypothetical protein